MDIDKKKLERELLLKIQEFQAVKISEEIFTAEAKLKACSKMKKLADFFDKDKLDNPQLKKSLLNAIESLIEQSNKKSRENIELMEKIFSETIHGIACTSDILHYYYDNEDLRENHIKSMDEQLRNCIDGNFTIM